MAEPRLIAALAYPDVQLLDIVGPLEAFNLASQQLIDDGEARQPSYRLEIISKNAEPTVSMSGLSLQSTRSMEDSVEHIDTLIIPGALTGTQRFHEDGEYIAWVRRAAGQVRRLCSVCSGALLLAAAGQLDGRRATTHWMDADLLRDCFPGVRVEPDQIWLEDSGVYTSGGITAGIDLALALIEQDHSRRLALKVAKRLLVFLKRPGSQSQFSSFLAAQAAPGPFESLVDWITENLTEELDTVSLARSAFMSERTFQRKFQAQYGMSAQRFILRARVNKARAQLEVTGSPIAAVARHCGFSSADSMRRAFVQELGVTPSAYRQRFGSAKA
jgi:transcriptional regulator GlxA family with amidase domain